MSATRIAASGAALILLCVLSTSAVATPCTGTTPINSGGSVTTSGNDQCDDFTSVGGTGGFVLQMAAGDSVVFSAPTITATDSSSGFPDAIHLTGSLANISLNSATLTGAPGGAALFANLSDNSNITLSGGNYTAGTGGYALDLSFGGNAGSVVTVNAGTTITGTAHLAATGFNVVRLYNSGTIEATGGDAVVFGGFAGDIELLSGSVTHGNIVADAGFSSAIDIQTGADVTGLTISNGPNIGAGGYTLGFFGAGTSSFNANQMLGAPGGIVVLDGSQTITNFADARFSGLQFVSVESSGALTIDLPAATFATHMAVDNSTTLSIGVGTGTVVNSGLVELGGTLIKTGGGVLEMTGAVKSQFFGPQGTVDVQGGTLTLGDGDADEVTIAGATVESGTVLNVSTSHPIDSLGALDIKGDFYSTNTSTTGGVFVYEGTLTGGFFGGGGVIHVQGEHVFSGDVTVATAAQLDISRESDAPLTISSNIGGDGDFVVSNHFHPGTITLSGDISIGTPGNSNYALGFDDGTFDFTGDNSGMNGLLFATASTVLIDNATDLGNAWVALAATSTLRFRADVDFTNEIDPFGVISNPLGQNTVEVDAGVTVHAIADIGAHTGGFQRAFSHSAPAQLVKTGEGTLIADLIDEDDVIVRQGTLRAGADLNMPTFTVETDGTFDLNDKNNTAASLFGSGTITNEGTAAGRMTVNYLTGTDNRSTFSGAIVETVTGTTALQVIGGTLTLTTGTNTFSGGLNVASGATLQIGDGTAAGTFNGDQAGNQVDGTFRLKNGFVTLLSPVSGGGNLDVTGGVLTLAVDNPDLTGGVTLSAGTLALQADGALGDNITNPDAKLTAEGAGGELDLADGVTIANEIDIDPNATLTVNVDGTGSTARLSASNTPPISGGVIGDGTTTLVKTGSGVLEADYIGVDGHVTITGGTLRATGGDFTLDPNATWTVNSTLDLNGSDQFIGPLLGTGIITNDSLTDDATVIVSYFGSALSDSTFSGVIRDGIHNHTTHLEVEDGMLTLTNTGTYTGGTLVCACAVLQLGNGTTLGNIAGDVEVDGELRFNQPSAFTFANAIDDEGLVSVPSGDITLSGGISGSGVIELDAGSLTLSGDNVNSGGGFGFDGEVDVNGGTLHVTRSEALGFADVFESDATVDLANNVSVITNFFVESGTTATFNVQTGSAHIGDCCDGGIMTDDPTAGAATMTKTGAGTLVLEFLDVSEEDFFGNPMATGTVNVNAGTLRIVGDQVIAGPADFTIASGATLDMRGSNGLGSLSGSGTVTNSSSSPVLLGVDYLFNVDWQSTFDGIIEDGAQPLGMSLAVDDGRLILRNVNTYTGVTLIGLGSTCGCRSPSDVGLQLGDGTTAGSIASSDVEIIFGELDFNEPSATTFAGAITVYEDGTIRVVNGDITLSGNLVSDDLSNPGAIVIDGGSLTLTGDNSGFAGDYTVAGTLHMGNLGTGTVHTVGTTLVYNNGDVVVAGVDIDSDTTQFSIDSGSATQQGPITESNPPRPMEKIGNGKLIVDSVSITGTTTITSGTLAGGATNAFSANSVVAVAASGTLDLNGFDQDVLDLSGTGAVLNNSLTNATLRINRSNGGVSTFDGTISDGVIGGTLGVSLGPNQTFFNGALTYTGTTSVDASSSPVLAGAGTNLIGAISLGGSDVVTVSNATGTVTLAGNIIGDNSNFFQVFGPGTLVLSGDNGGYNGTMILAGGTVKLLSNTALGATTAQVSQNATVVYGAGVSIANPLGLDSTSAPVTFEVDNNDSAEQVGGVSEPGGQHAGFTKTGTGTLIVDGLHNSGATTISQGTLKLGATNGLSPNSVLTVNATLDMNGFSQFPNGIAGLQGSGTVTNTAGGPVTLTIDYSNSQFGPGVITGSVFAGAITNAPGHPLWLAVDHGTLTLTGANTYTGQTLICDCATLQIGDGTSNTGSLSDSTFVVNNNLLIFARTGAYTAGFEIDDGLGHAGSVQLTTTGVTTLTNTASNYSGGTFIQDSAVLIVTGNTVGTGPVNLFGSGGFTAGADNLSFNNPFSVNLNGGAFDTGSNTLTITGQVTDPGAGALTKVGSGTLHLTNTGNNYHDGTNIKEGTLWIDDGSELGGALLVAIGTSSTHGTLRFDSNGTFAKGIQIALGGGTLFASSGFAPTFSGSIGGAGKANIDGDITIASTDHPGSGWEVASGSQLTFTGSVAGGTVILDDASSAVVFDGSVISGNDISGPGCIEVRSGNATLESFRSWDQDGILQIDDGAALQLNGSLRNGMDVRLLGTAQLTVGFPNILHAIDADPASTVNVGGSLTLDNDADATFAGIFTGGGTFAKDGAGTLILTSVNSTYTGLAEINAGTLEVDGTFPGHVSIGGGTLSGTGTVTSIDLQTGFLSPGPGIGKLTATTGLSITGGTYLVELSPTDSDQVDASNNTVQLNGTLALNFQTGVSYTPHQYVIIDRGNYFGSFGTIDSLGLPTGFKISVGVINSSQLAVDLAYADFIWSSTPGSSDWFTDANWQANLSPGHAVGSQDVVFGPTNTPTVHVNLPTTVASLQFAGGAPAYRFHFTDGFTIDGTGIVDSSGNPPMLDADDEGALQFINNATAGDAIINVAGGGFLRFRNNATAGNAQIAVASGGEATFFDNAAPTGSTVIANDGTVDFSATSGPLGDNKLDVKSISGAGDFKLGANTLSDGQGFETSAEVSGTIEGSGGLMLISGGTLVLSGANTYTGVTTLQFGRLTIGNGGTTGSIVSDVDGGGVLTFNRSDDLTFGGAITDTVLVIQAGSGVVALTGNNSYSGATLLNGGGGIAVGNDHALGTGSVLIRGAGTVRNDAGTITLANNFVLFQGQATFDTNGNDLTLSGDFSSDFATSLTKTGAGKLTLNGTGSTFPMAVNEGTLRLEGGAPVPGNISNGGTIAAGATLELALTDGTHISTNISGDGLLVKDGAGELTLLASLLAARAQVRAGRLVIGAFGNGFLTSDVEVDAGATLKFDGFNFSGYQGVISGAGAVFIDAGGTARFDGDNTYTGGTTVSGTTVQLGATGSIVGDVVLSDSSATLAFGHSDTVVFGGTISGAGGVMQLGSGELQLTGTNTYSGGTTVFNGILAIANAGEVGSGAVNVDATVRFDAALTSANDYSMGIAIFDTNGHDVTITGGVDGTELIKAGSGTLTLTGSTDWFGGTGVQAGMLILAGTTGYSGFTDVASGARLFFHTSGNVTVSGDSVTGGGVIEIGGGTNIIFSGVNNFAPDVVTDATDSTITLTRGTITGVISGSGHLVTQTLTTTLVATNTYTGGTTIDSGSLRLGNGGTTGSVLGDIVDNGTLVFERSDDLTFGAAISGSGSLVQQGTGTVTLTGTSTYTGRTTVLSGTLRVNGSIDSAVTALNGTTLTGAGIVGSAVILTGSTIAPGNSIGTLHVNGDLTLQNGSHMLAEFSPTDADLISATGAVSIGGDLIVSFATGAPYAPHVYTLITTTDSLNGTFTQVTGLAPTGFGYNVSTDGQNAYLNLIYQQFIWASNPASSDWTVDANWQNGLAPPNGQDVFFGVSTQSEVDLNAGLSVSEASLQFTSSQSYLIKVSAGASLTLTGQGVVDTSNSKPAITADGGLITFTNSATAGDAALTARNAALVTFSGNSTAASAALAAFDTSGFDFTGTTGSSGNNQVSAGSIAGDGGIALGANRLTVGSNNASTTFSGIISGSGGLTKTGTGTLTLAGSNNYSGGTTIAAGTLQIGNGGTSGSVVGDIVTNGTLAFNYSDDRTFGAVISGTGGVAKNGTNTLTLSATETYTGTTAVNGGTLVLAGSAASSAVNVNSGGTFAGTGATASITVASGGTLSPGNGGIGTLATAGALTLGGTYLVEVNATSSDVVDAGGAVTLGGALGVNFQTNVAYLPHQYTIATGTSVSGSFASINSLGLPTGFVIGVSTNATNVFLDLDYAAFVWGANPGTTNWFTDANWQAGLSPSTAGGSRNVLFGATTKPTVDIGSGNVQEASLQFTAGTPSYTFHLSGNAQVTLDGLGIVDAPGNHPSFVLSDNLRMVFANSAGAADAQFALHDLAKLTFNDQSTAGSSTITSDGFNAVTFDGHATAGTASIDIQGHTILNFNGNSTPGSAAISGEGFTIVDFSGTTGPNGDNKISAGSIGGTAGYHLGANELTVGSNNASTEASGTIEGTGSLVKVGTGTLILSASNTYTGGTTISAGTLQIGNGGGGGAIVGNVVDNSILAVNTSGSLTLAGIISGTGVVKQIGSGTLTLAGANTYTGATQVSAGTLSLTGSVTSVVTVSGGTLAGTGTMAGLAVASGASVSPGVGGVGTLTVNGAASLASGATYAFNATTGVSDLIMTSGAASLGGTVVVTPAAGTYTINSRIALVTTTAGVSGTFAGLTLNGSFGTNIRPVLDYDATHAYLLLRPVAISTLLPPDASENVIDIAHAIDEAILNDNGGGTFGPLADLSQADLVKVLEQMDGEVSNSVPDGAFENLGSFLELLLDPANENRSGGTGPALSFIAPDDHPSLSLADPVSAASPRPAEGGSAVFLRGPVSVWGALRGGWSNHGGDAVLGSHPTNVSNGLMALGIDVRPEGQDLVLGAGVALGQVWWNVHPGLGSGHSNSQQFGVYGSKRFGQFYVSMAAAFAQFESTTMRTVVFGGLNAYRAHVDGQGQGFRGEAGYRFEDGDGMGLTPYASFTAQGITTSSYDEVTVTGNPAFALHFPHQHETEVSSEVGLAVDRVLSGANDNALSIEARVGWWHDYSSDISRSGSLLAFPGTSFVVRGVSPPRDAAQLLLGLDAEISDGLSLQAKAQTLLGGNVQEYAGNLALKVEW